MKSFLKYTLATITGLIIAGILFLFISLAGFSAMIASADKPVSIKSNSVLVLNTGLNIPEKGTSDPLSSFDPVSFTFSPAAGINNILSNLDKAVKDDKIKGVLIENGPMINGWGKAEEIRNALIKFKKSGKFVISYTDYILTQESYFISTAADKVFVNPNAMMEFKGLASEVVFYKNALEKLGINVQVIRHGKYKGAVERFMLDRLSEENRQQITTYINAIWDHVISRISEARNISAEELNRLADDLVGFDIEKAQQAGLVDGLIYKDQLLEELANLTGTETDKKPELVSMAKYSKVITGDNEKAESSIAVVYAEGNINVGKGQTGTIGGESFSEMMRKIRKSNDYKAVVIRINSPGGSAIASDNIWREIELTKQQIPVVVSMSNYAASGGYYMAAPATKIFAQPTTITGSIGVFGLFPEASGLMETKLGITSEVVKTNKNADILSVFREMNGQEKAVYQQNIDNTYEQFVNRVSDGRGIDRAIVDDMGQGQVYGGNDALNKNLVDYIGGLNDAIDEAAKLASLDNYKLKEFPKEEDPYTKLMKSLTGDIRAKIIKRELGVLAKHYETINELKGMTGIQARLPYYLDIR